MQPARKALEVDDPVGPDPANTAKLLILVHGRREPWLDGQRSEHLLGLGVESCPRGVLGVRFGELCGFLQSSACSFGLWLSLWFGLLLVGTRPSSATGPDVGGQRDVRMATGVPAFALLAQSGSQHVAPLVAEPTLRVRNPWLGLPACGIPRGNEGLLQPLGQVRRLVARRMPKSNGNRLSPVATTLANGDVRRMDGLKDGPQRRHGEQAAGHPRRRVSPTHAGEVAGY